MFTGLVMFVFVSAIAFVVLACALAVSAGRNLSSEKYDERQQIDRGHAYRFSWWVGMVYYFGLAVYFIFHTGEGEWPLEPFLLLFIGILIQLQSFHIYCIMTHSALPLGEKPVGTIVSYFLLGSMYLAQYFLQYIPEDTPYLFGARSMNLFRLLIALDFFSLAIQHLIAHLRKEQE